MIKLFLFSHSVHIVIIQSLNSFARLIVQFSPLMNKGSSIIVIIFTSVHSVLFFVTPSQKRTLKMLIQNGRDHKPTFEISPRRCMRTFAKFNC